MEGPVSPVNWEAGPLDCLVQVLSKVVDERKNLFPMSAEGQVKRMGKRFWSDRDSHFSSQKMVLK
jgi:hypothetical protein